MGVGRGVGDEAPDVCGRRRQSGEIQTDAPQPGVTIRLRRGPQRSGFQFREDEAVDGIQRPRFIAHRRRFRIGHRLERPELSPLLDVDDSRLLCRDCRDTGIGRAHGHPFFQHLDLARRQLALRRHLQIGIDIAHGPDEQALVEAPRHHRRSVVAARLPPGLHIQREAALDLLFMRMALVAALLKHGQHLGFKECNTILRPRGGEQECSHDGALEGEVHGKSGSHSRQPGMCSAHENARRREEIAIKKGD